jgi:hypothetical protein
MGITDASPPLRITMVELDQRFDQHVKRFVLRPPSGKDRRSANRDVARAWLDLIIVEKLRQRNLIIEGKDASPALNY